MSTIYITLPIGSIWQDVNPDEFMADDTETQYLDDVERALNKHFAGKHNFDVCFANVYAMTIDDNGTGVNNNDIRTVIDRVEVDYIEIDNEEYPEDNLTKEEKDALEAEAFTSITPHKGGRSERINARLTPDEKRRLTQLLSDKKLSLSDWIMEQVWKHENAKTRYINIDERYGDPEKVTIYDYQELNPEGNFTQDESGIYEDGRLIASAE